MWRVLLVTWVSLATVTSVHQGKGSLAGPIFCVILEAVPKVPVSYNFAVCGKRKTREGTRGRIINGREVSSGKLPWMAALFYRDQPDSKEGEAAFGCSGSLVSHWSGRINHIVT